MAGWHHWLHGHESGWTPGVGGGQGGLACWDSWGRKESDTTERLIWCDLSQWYLEIFLRDLLLLCCMSYSNSSSCYLEQKSSRFWRNDVIRSRDPSWEKLIVTCLIQKNFLAVLNPTESLWFYLSKLAFPSCAKWVCFHSVPRHGSAWSEMQSLKSGPGALTGQPCFVLF